MAETPPSNDENKKPTLQEQVMTAEAIFNMVMKFILMVIGAVAFFMVLVHFLNAKEPIEKSITGAFDGILGFSIYKVYDFYFSRSKNDENPKPPKKITKAKEP